MKMQQRPLLFWTVLWFAHALSQLFMRVCSKQTITFVERAERTSIGNEMETLSSNKWSVCLDSEGRIFDQYTIRKTVFHKARNIYWLNHTFIIGLAILCI